MNKMKFLVSGLVNLETTLRIERFPLEYAPVLYPFFGAYTAVSGVGYNVARALHTLGDDAHLLALIGSDPAADWVRQTLRADELDGAGVLPVLAETPQSVILYDRTGQRQIHVDLKDIQEQAYPAQQFELALQACDMAVLCNINFSRPYLAQARDLGKLVATDVHTLSRLEDDYNRDFMANADILFLSDECLQTDDGYPEAPENFVRRLVARYPAQIVVVGLGSQGALLYVRADQYMQRFPAVYTRPVVNTIGAGDALFSCFVHTYAHTQDPYLALQRALVFASYKIGEKGATQGFLSSAELDRLSL